MNSNSKTEKLLKYAALLVVLVALHPILVAGWVPGYELVLWLSIPAGAVALGIILVIGLFLHFRSVESRKNRVIGIMPVIVLVAGLIVWWLSRSV